MNDAKHHARIRWRCHRGMLELDLLLLPFFDNHFDKLSQTQQQQFEKLLQQQDPPLFAALMGHEVIAEPELETIVATIRAYHRDTIKS